MDDPKQQKHAQKTTDDENLRPILSREEQKREYNRLRQTRYREKEKMKRERMKRERENLHISEGMPNIIDVGFSKELPRLTQSDLIAFEYINQNLRWRDLISQDLLDSLTSLETVLAQGGHSLWEELPEASHEETQTEATMVMWLTKLVDSKKVRSLHFTRRSIQPNAIGNVQTDSDHEKRKWFRQCLEQIGAKSVKDPLFAIAHADLIDAEPVQPLQAWTKRKPAIVQVPSLGTSVMVTPTGGFTDIHADSTTVGRAVCIGGCKKLWLLWPPTPKNLKLWADNRGLGISIQRYGHLLEGGLVVQTSGEEDHNALTMGAGTLHAVFTLNGGILSGVNYSTAEDIRLAGEMLQLQVQRNQDQDQIHQDCVWFENTADEILTHPYYAVQGLVSMARILAKIDEFGRTGEAGWKHIISKGPQFFQKYRQHARQKSCNCGKTLPKNPKDLQKHFLDDSHGL